MREGRRPPHGWRKGCGCVVPRAMTGPVPAHIGGNVMRSFLLLPAAVGAAVVTLLTLTPGEARAQRGRMAPSSRLMVITMPTTTHTGHAPTTLMRPTQPTGHPLTFTTMPLASGSALVTRP